MPVYEYECKDCKKVFEVYQKMSDAPIASCPDCKGEVRKLVSMSSFQLKGGGWYADGYASSGNGSGSHKTSKESKGKSSTPAKKGSECASCPAAAGGK